MRWYILCCVLSEVLCLCVHSSTQNWPLHCTGGVTSYTLLVCLAGFTTYLTPECFPYCHFTVAVYDFTRFDFTFYSQDKQAFTRWTVCEYFVNISLILLVLCCFIQLAQWFNASKVLYFYHLISWNLLPPLTLHRSLSFKMFYVVSKKYVMSEYFYRSVLQSVRVP
jgi:hypothetical protein